MRLVTTCPQCEAAFYVTPEQLSAHRGDVRCGKCEHVFNALDRLAEVASEPSAKAESAESESVGKAQSVTVGVAEPAPQPLPEAESPSKATVGDIEIIAEHDEPAEHDKLLDEPPKEVASEVTPQTKTVDQPPPAEQNISSAQPAFSITDFSVPPAANILSPTMMDDAARNKTGSARKSGFLRFILMLLVLLLMLLALGQAAYFLRSDITARWPQARPYLEQACTWLQCKVTLPQNADLFAIDDSDLKEDTERQGLIHLHTTLINHADYSQEFPLLELTLTDVNDKPLLRRTFEPQQYLPAGADIRRGVSARGRIDIRLSLTAEDKAIAGYRLFVTY